jgi:gp010
VARKAKAPRTPEESENMLINLAVTLAEKQLRDGTASPSVISHYLKLAGQRDKLELEKLRQETMLAKAKAESIASAARTEELVQEAVNAMRRYSGGENDVF